MTRAASLSSATAAAGKHRVLAATAAENSSSEALSSHAAGLADLVAIGLRFVEGSSRMPTHCSLAAGV